MIGSGFYLHDADFRLPSFPGLSWKSIMPLYFRIKNTVKSSPLPNSTQATTSAYSEGFFPLGSEIPGLGARTQADSFKLRSSGLASLGQLSKLCSRLGV